MSAALYIVTLSMGPSNSLVDNMELIELEGKCKVTVRKQYFRYILYGKWWGI